MITILQLILMMLAMPFVFCWLVVEKIWLEPRRKRESDKWFISTESN